MNTEKVGFTGTRYYPTFEQRDAFNQLIGTWKPSEFHHGDCVGADAMAAEMVWRDFRPRTRIVCHPPTNTKDRAYTLYHEIRDPIPYLARNRAIVDECDVLIAIPKTAEEEQRSGTWSTVRYARKKGKPIYIIQPLGVIILNNV